MEHLFHTKVKAFLVAKFFMRSTLSHKGWITLGFSAIFILIALFFTGDVRSFFFTLGITAVVGCATNGIAIRMLFDRIYLLPKHQKIPVPYSGILEMQRVQIAQAIGWVVAKRLVSPAAVLRVVTTPEFQTSTSQIIKDKLSILAHNPDLIDLLVEEIEKSLLSFIDSDVFWGNVQERIYQKMGKAGVLLLAVELMRGRELIAPIIQSEIKTILQGICDDPRFEDQVQAMVENLLDRLQKVGDDIKQNFQTQGLKMVEELIHEVDIQTMVANEIAGFAPGELSNIVLKITNENLDWLEVWGGALGGIGGVIFWALGKCF